MLPDSVSRSTEPINEIARIRRVFGARDSTIPADFYAWHRAENQYSQARVARVCSRLLKKGSALPLANSSILDVGCGNGQWLLEFLQWGAARSNLSGIDLMEGRLSCARDRLPGADLRNGDASQLPWPEASFDLVTQFTVFSSISSRPMQVKAAAEMIRVLRPGGHVLWYDLRWSNPSSNAVRGLDRNDIRNLFPSCKLHAVTTTLAPPLSRTVARVSWTLASAVENLRFTCSHLAALITPERA